MPLAGELAPACRLGFLSNEGLPDRVAHGAPSDLGGLRIGRLALQCSVEALLRLPLHLDAIELLTTHTSAQHGIVAAVQAAVISTRAVKPS